MTSVDRIQGLSGSLAVKTPCRVATTANITLSGEQTIDAVAVVEGNRVLVKNQTDTTENGIYNVSTGAWTRALDFDGAKDFVQATAIVVQQGSVNAGSMWKVTTASPAVGSALAFDKLTPGDADTVEFTQAGTGAVARSAQDKLREIVSVKDFGALGDGSNDDTAEIQAAIDYAESLAAASPNRGMVVYFPPGQYIVSATLTITTSRVSLRGAGSSHVRILRAANYGNTFTILSETAGTLNILTRVEISGMTLEHNTAPAVAMTGIHIQAVAVTYLRIIDVEITNGKYGIALYGCVDVEIDSCYLVSLSTGGVNNATVGVGLYDAAASGYALGSAVSLPTEVMLHNTEIFGTLNTGWNYGLLINAGEDVTISNCYLGNASVANVLIQQTSRNKLILEVAFTNGTYIDGAGEDSVKIEGDGGDGTEYIGSVSFDGIDIKGQGGQTNNGIFVSGTSRGGTFAQACVNLRVNGCRIGDFDESGIRIDGCVNAMLSNNIIGGNNYNNATGGRGILLGAACTRVSVNGGRSGGLSYGAGTSFQAHGIEIVVGASELHIDGVDVSNNTTGGVLDNAAAVTTAARTVWVTNCRGYNGARAAKTGLAVPLTTVAQYNPYGAPCWVGISGGTVSAIKLNGTTYATATGTGLLVGPGDYITLEYTVAPTWVWWPQ